jgi:hypothetical protein
MDHHPYAFPAACGSVLLLSVLAYRYLRQFFDAVWETGKLHRKNLICVCFRFSFACVCCFFIHSFSICLLENSGSFSFFDEINNVEFVNKHMKMDRNQIQEVLASISGRQVTPGEVEKIFKLVKNKELT